MDIHALKDHIARSITSSIENMSNDERRNLAIASYLEVRRSMFDCVLVAA